MNAMRGWIGALTAAVVMACAGVAWADAVPPDGAPCASHAEGDACIMMDGSSGVCVTAPTMRRLPDGAAEPTTYLACRAGSPAMDAGPDGGSSTAHGGCGCATTGGRTAPGALAALATAGIAVASGRRGRRRRRRDTRA